MRFIAPLLAALATCALAASPAFAGHGDKLLDHPAPLVPTSPAANPGFQATPSGAWQLLGSIPTGNPQSDLDFFTRDGNISASVGTLATAPNRGGQTIVKLTNGDQVAPSIVGAAPTASCFSNPIDTLSLQHDVEATPKGNTILNTFNPFAPTGDAQLILDASDSSGRCHDQGVLSVANAPNGGIEIIDVTNPAQPVTIGLTSHIGEAHTVNVDPKRPHIAYAVTSDLISVNAQGVRSNETATATTEVLDGFEMINLRSCMNFPAGTSVEQKRASCNPQVFRYRYPTAQMGMGHSDKTFIFGCHELEVYPDDRLTCAGGTALLTFDLSGAFDDKGTPDDYTDDEPRGTPLPCHRRDSSSARLPVPGAPSFFTAAKVNDCDEGGADGSQSLHVRGWLNMGAPSLEGVRYLGSVHHTGGTDQGTPAAQPPSEDIIFDHEAELSQSGNLLIATDERGGGALPPGASCAGQGSTQGNPLGNGGVSFYRVDKLDTALPASANEAWDTYARTPEGRKALYRAPIRTGAQAIICTAHVFHQIPGQNRIFMGWYSQGTQVIDFTENPDGTVTLREAGSFIPVQANQWVSAIFKAQENADGTFTYWGAAAALRLGDGGRNTIDIYRVTLPAPPRPADGPGVLPRRIRGQEVRDPRTGETVIAGTQAGAPRCVANRPIRSASVRRRGRRLSFAFRATAPVTIDLFRQTRGRRVSGEVLVRRFRNVTGAVRWNGRDSRGRRLRDGHYLVRFAAQTPAGVMYERRFGLLLRNGRFRVLARHESEDTCGLLRRFKLLRSVFGGRSNRPLTISFRFANDARAEIIVRRRGGRVIRRFVEQQYVGGVLHRKRIGRRLTRRLPRGRYTVTLIVRDGARTITRTLNATRF